VAAYALLTYALLPLGLRLHPDMRAVFESYRLGIYGHVFGSTIAMTLGPFQFASRLRSRLPQVHRWLGRLYLGVGVLVRSPSNSVACHGHSGLTSHPRARRCGSQALDDPQLLARLRGSYSAHLPTELHHLGHRFVRRTIKGSSCRLDGILLASETIVRLPCPPHRKVPDFICTASRERKRAGLSQTLF
jgi:hypothetical protein